MSGSAESGTRDIVERVREATDIVELIGAYVQLRPSGRSFKGLCPFHTEKTPSFVVSPERQLFHCFGCGVGGDVFTFLMKHDGLSFAEALEVLARRAGIEIPKRREASGGIDRAVLLDALRAAVRYYRAVLRHPRAARAREYLSARGLHQETLDAYYVGYAPPSGKGLLKYLGTRFPSDALLQAGLLRRTEDGRFYDWFRDRVVMPVLSVSGDPVAFGARAIDKGVEPKYLNSPESPVYSKSRVLFGLAQARRAIATSGEALVVEGYFDVLSLASAGISNTVAPCGTAWTQEHARLLARYAKRIIFVFDGDEAGRKAALRAIGATLPVTPELRIARLPEGKDPDDLVREEGASGVLRRVGEATGAVGFIVDALAAEGLPVHRVVEEAASRIALCGSPAAAEVMLEELASRLRLPVAVVRRELERARKVPSFGRREAPSEAPAADTPRELSALEQACVRAALVEPRLAERILEAAGDSLQLGPEVRRVLEEVASRWTRGGRLAPPEALRMLGSEDLQALDVGFLIEGEGPPVDEEFVDDLLRRLEAARIEHELGVLGHKIRAAEQQGEDSLGAMLARKQELARRLSVLKRGGAAGEGGH